MSEKKKISERKPFLKINLHLGFTPSKRQGYPDDPVIQDTKIQYGTLEWNNFIERMKKIGVKNGMHAPTLVSANIKTKEGYEVVDLDDNYDFKELVESELKSSFTTAEALTPQEKEVADLRELVAKLQRKVEGSSPESIQYGTQELKLKGGDQEIPQELKDEYKELTGKNPSHLMKYDTFMRKLQEHRDKAAQ